MEFLTTSEVAPEQVVAIEQALRAAVRGLRHRTLLKAGCVLVGWLGLALLLCWVDRLSRGYMTGRLWAIGLLCSAALPSLLFFV